MKISFDKINWNGRFLDYKNIRYFNYSSSGFNFTFTGKKAEAVLISNTENYPEENLAVIAVYITKGKNNSLKDLSENPEQKIILRKNENKITLFESDKRETVTIRVIKISECAFAKCGLKELDIDGKIIANKTDNLKLEFIGDSITCGYGIDGIWEKDIFTTAQERSDKSYAFLTAKNLNADIQCVSWSGIGITSNYIDPETQNLPDTHLLMPALWPYTDKDLTLNLKIKNEIWDSKKYEPDVIIIHLGTNDISYVRKIEDRRLTFVSCYRQLLEAVHRRSPDAKIICCLGAMGNDLNESVQEAVNLFTNDFSDAVCSFTEFPIQKEEDGIGTDWHPSYKTHKIMAEILTKAIQKLF